MGLAKYSHHIRGQLSGGPHLKDQNITNIERDGDKEVTGPVQGSHYVEGSDSLSHRS